MYDKLWKDYTGGGFTGQVYSATVVEDVKGMTTAMFKLKAKLMKAVHGIEVRVVKTPTAVI